MKNKGITIAIIVVIILMAVYFLWQNASQEKNEKSGEVKIGCIYPLSGNGAQYGEYFRMGTELALQYSIKKQKITPNDIEFIYEDGKGLANESISALNKLISNDDISGCLTDLSSVLVPIKPVINSNKIPTINSSSFSSSIEDDDDYMFSILPNADSYARQIAEFSYKTLGKRKAAIIYRNDDMGTSFEKVFTRVFESLGGEVVFREGHDKGETNYKVISQKLRAQSDADIVFCASYGVEVARLLKQLKEDNYSNTYITFQGFIIPDVFNIAGSATEGVYILGSGFTTLDNEMISEISSLSSNLYNIERLNFYTAAHFDAAMMFIDAISKGYKTGEEIREYFDSDSYSYSFKGITGNLIFDQNGLVDLELVPYRVIDGKFENVSR